MSRSNVTGILNKICAETDAYADQIELKGTEVNIGRAADNTIVWPSIQLSRKHVCLQYNRKSKKWQIKHSSTNGVLINDEHLGRDILIDLKDGDEIQFIPTGTLKYAFNYPKKEHKPSTPEEPLRIAVIEVKEELEEPTPVPTMEVDFDSEPERSLSRCSDMSLLSINSGNSDSENRIQMKKMQDKLLKSLENLSDHPSWNSNDCQSQSQSLLSDDPEPSPKRSRYQTCGSNHTTSMTQSSQQESFSTPQLSSSKSSLDMKDAKGERLKQLEEEIHEWKVKYDRLWKANTKVEADMNLLQNTSHVEIEMMQIKINEAKFETNFVREELTSNFIRALESEFSCVICNEIYVNASVISCGHTFCTFCISTWAKKKNECPTCRAKITSRIRHVEIDNFISKVLVENPISESMKLKRAEAIKEKEENEVAEREREAAEREAMNGQAAAALQLQHQLGIDFEMLQPRVQLASRGGRRGRGSRNGNPQNPPLHLPPEVEDLSFLRLVNEDFMFNLFPSTAPRARANAQPQPQPPPPPRASTRSRR